MCDRVLQAALFIRDVKCNMQCENICSPLLLDIVVIYEILPYTVGLCLYKTCLFALLFSP